MPGDIGGDHARHVGRVGEERAEEPDGAELDGEPETIVIAAANLDQRSVSVVEMEVPVELLQRRFSGIPAKGRPAGAELVAVLVIGQRSGQLR